jgi:hypothetical protein
MISEIQAQGERTATMKRHSRTGLTLFQMLIVVAGEVQRINARLGDAEDRLTITDLE